MSFGVRKYMLLSAAWGIGSVGKGQGACTGAGAFLLPCSMSSQWWGALCAPSDWGAAQTQGKEGQDEECNTAWQQHIASRPAFYWQLALLKAALKCALVLLLSCWHQERETRTVPQTISVSVILLGFHQLKPLVIIPFSISWDSGWPWLLQCSKQSSAAQDSGFLFLW